MEQLWACLNYDRSETYFCLQLEHFKCSQERGKILHMRVVYDKEGKEGLSKIKLRD